MSPMAPDTLFVGPYVGEFGWEVGKFAPLARGIAHLGQYDRVVACSFPDRAALYADFATEFVPHDIACVSECMKWYRHDKPKEFDSWCPEGHRLAPETIGRHGHNFLRGRYEDYLAPLCYGTRMESGFDVVFHRRERRDLGTERNWPEEHWEGLATWCEAQGLSTACIGHSPTSAPVPCAENLIDAGLSMTMNVLASSGVCVGPSSGPMHLAQHCGCAVVTWVGFDIDLLVQRYRRDWNPFRVPTQVFGFDKWNPATDTITAGIAQLLEVSCLSSS